MFQSPQADSSLCTINNTFITPKEARSVHHEKLINTKMEPGLDPDDYISTSFTFEPGGRCCECLEETRQTAQDELYNDGIVLQRLPVEYERIHHASYEGTNDYGLDDSCTWHTR